ncbi:hypothetical protein HMN09_00733200 [Mycena chlorophos]|uniref:Uncharacterized protein n=1 Tax=Mycena chlorophos TaxID=658473 RepID=A0A8H6SUT8_MYCCL|nr:hypothetical protein HMN09_00733200 [Mycena chlorophos]
MLTTTNPYRPTVRRGRARSSSLTIVTAKAQAVVQTMKTVTRPRAASDPGPRFQRSLCPPRKSCLKSTPTTFEPELPAGFEDDLVDEAPELDSSLPSSEESSILSVDSESDNEKKLSRVFTLLVRVKLALRRRSHHAPTHNHAHPSPSRLSVLPLTMPQFSQPGYCTEPVVAFVDGEYEDDDVCAGGVRFVVPDDSHLKQGMDESVMPVEEEEDDDDEEELSWAAMQ